MVIYEVKLARKHSVNGNSLVVNSVEEGTDAGEVGCFPPPVVLQCFSQNRRLALACTATKM